MAKDPRTREPEWNLSEWIMNPQNQLTALLVFWESAVGWTQAVVLLLWVLPLASMRKEILKIHLAFLSCWSPYGILVYNVQYNDNKKAMHLFGPFSWDDSWTHLLYISFVSLLLISLGRYQHTSHLWPPTIKLDFLQIRLGLSYLVSCYWFHAI